MKQSENPGMDYDQYLQADLPGQIEFFGNDTAELFSREIIASFEAVLRKNYKRAIDPPFRPGYVTASVDGRPWHDTLWTRDTGTFLRECTLWGNLHHASLTADCLIKLVTPNAEGYLTFPEYFKTARPASGDELDGTAAIIIGLLLLWQRLPDENPYKKAIFDFLHQAASPLQYIHRKLIDQPLLAGSGEFGGGCGITGRYVNVVQNNLVRLALLAGARLESEAGQPELAQYYRHDAEKLRQNMLRYLLDADGSWLWCIDPGILRPDLPILNHPINKGFGGINGVTSMLADVLGLDTAGMDSKIIDAGKKTFQKLLSFPLRGKQFDRFGIWTQFDEFRLGCSSGPSYGHGYALQVMLLFDELELAEKALAYLAQATFNPPAEYEELERESPYYFYERFYSPDFAGREPMEQGCGALNLVNVTEPLKVARMILGADDYSSDDVKLIPRVPMTWTGFKAQNWPLRTPGGLSRADISFERIGGKIHFRFQLRSGAALPRLLVRLAAAGTSCWYEREQVTAFESTL